MEKEPEIVICAAVRADDGYIVRGHRHNDAIRTLRGIPRYADSKSPHGEDQGFVTSRNRYVTRREGCEIQKAAGIPSFYERDPQTAHKAYLYGELYSEDLY